jgi:hypothetical protein
VKELISPRLSLDDMVKAAHAGTSIYFTTMQTW